MRDDHAHVMQVKLCKANTRGVTKATTDTALHRTADEPPSRLQCRHGRHSSATSHHVTTWPEDHDDSHARMNTRRQHSLQATLARTSLRLTTLRSGEPPPLYAPWPQTLYKGSQGTHLDILILYHFTHSPS